MRRYRIHCDGCDAVTDNPYPEIPMNWAELQVSIIGFTYWDSGGGREFAGTIHLCQHCQLKYQDAMRPKKWPRLAVFKPTPEAE